MVAVFCQALTIFPILDGGDLFLGSGATNLLPLMLGFFFVKVGGLFSRGCFFLGAWTCLGLLRGSEACLAKSFCLDAWLWSGLCQGSEASLAKRKFCLDA